MRAVYIVVVVVVGASLVGEGLAATRHRRQLGLCGSSTRDSTTACKFSSNGKVGLGCSACVTKSETKDDKKERTQDASLRDNTIGSEGQKTTSSDYTYTSSPPKWSISHTQNKNLASQFGITTQNKTNTTTKTGLTKRTPAGSESGTRLKTANFFYNITTSRKKNDSSYQIPHTPSGLVWAAKVVQGSGRAQDKSIATVMGLEGRRLDELCETCKENGLSCECFGRELKNGGDLTKFQRLLKVVCENNCCCRPSAGYARPPTSTCPFCSNLQHHHPPPTPDPSNHPPTPDHSYHPPTPDQPFFPLTPDHRYPPPFPDNIYPPSIPSHSSLHTPGRPNLPPIPGQAYNPPIPGHTHLLPIPDQNYSLPIPDYKYPSPIPGRPNSPPIPSYPYPSLIPDHPSPLPIPACPCHPPIPAHPIPDLTHRPPIPGQTHHFSSTHSRPPTHPPPTPAPPSSTPQPDNAHPVIILQATPSPTRPPVPAHPPPNVLSYCGKMIVNNEKDSYYMKTPAFPSFAAVLREVPHSGGVTQTIIMCSGSLIHPSLVLTAAHCVTKITTTSLKVRLGAWNTRLGEDVTTQQERGVMEIAIHDHFNMRTLSNDIALLYLSKPVLVSSNAVPICLGHVVGPTQCLAVGLGGDNVITGMVTPVWHRDKCQRCLNMMNVEGQTLHQPSFLCTSNRIQFYKSSGSPLLCRDPTDGSYWQAGVMAFGRPFATGVTRVYINISQEHQWILNTAQDLLTRL